MVYYIFSRNKYTCDTIIVMSDDNLDEIEVPQKKQGRVQHTLRWQAHEYAYTRKPADWYWKVGIVAFGVAAASYVLDNILFSILTIIGGFTFALFGAKKPDMLDMEISPKGIRIHNKLHPYSELDFFWVSEHSSEPKILIQGVAMLRTHIILPLGDLDPEDARDELLKYMKEDEIAEPMTQRIIDRTGF